MTTSEKVQLSMGLIFQYEPLEMGTLVGFVLILNVYIDVSPLWIVHFSNWVKYYHVSNRKSLVLIFKGLSVNKGLCEVNVRAFEAWFQN